MAKMNENTVKAVAAARDAGGDASIQRTARDAANGKATAIKRLTLAAESTRVHVDDASRRNVAGAKAAAKVLGLIS